MPKHSAYVYIFTSTKWYHTYWISLHLTLLDDYLLIPPIPNCPQVKEFEAMKEKAREEELQIAETKMVMHQVRRRRHCVID